MNVELDAEMDAGVDGAARVAIGHTGDSIADVVARCRAGLRRLTPLEVQAAQRHGALVVDTRTSEQRRAQGELPGAVVIDRTVLEWRLDPTSADRIAEATDHDVHVIVVCRQGYSSALAAVSLQQVGLRRATDMIGGMEAWLRDGLPVHSGEADVRF